MIQTAAITVLVGGHETEAAKLKLHSAKLRELFSALGAQTLLADASRVSEELLEKTSSNLLQNLDSFQVLTSRVTALAERYSHQLGWKPTQTSPHSFDTFHPQAISHAMQKIDQGLAERPHFFPGSDIPCTSVSEAFSYLTRQVSAEAHGSLGAYAKANIGRGGVDLLTGDTQAARALTQQLLLLREQDVLGNKGGLNVNTVSSEDQKAALRFLQDTNTPWFVEEKKKPTALLSQRDKQVAVQAEMHNKHKALFDDFEEHGFVAHALSAFDSVDQGQFTQYTPEGQRVFALMLAVNSLPVKEKIQLLNKHPIFQQALSSLTPKLRDTLFASWVHAHNRQQAEATIAQALIQSVMKTDERRMVFGSGSGPTSEPPPMLPRGSKKGPAILLSLSLVSLLAACAPPGTPPAVGVTVVKDATPTQIPTIVPTLGPIIEMTPVIQPAATLTASPVDAFDGVGIWGAEAQRVANYDQIPGFTHLYDNVVNSLAAAGLDTSLCNPDACKGLVAYNKDGVFEWQVVLQNADHSQTYLFRKSGVDALHNEAVYTIETTQTPRGPDGKLLIPTMVWQGENDANGQFVTNIEGGNAFLCFAFDKNGNGVVSPNEGDSLALQVYPPNADGTTMIRVLDPTVVDGLSVIPDGMAFVFTGNRGGFVKFDQNGQISPNAQHLGADGNPAEFEITLSPDGKLMARILLPTAEPTQPPTPEPTATPNLVEYYSKLLAGEELPASSSRNNQIGNYKEYGADLAYAAEFTTKGFRPLKIDDSRVIVATRFVNGRTLVVDSAIYPIFTNDNPIFDSTNHIVDYMCFTTDSKTLTNPGEILSAFNLQHNTPMTLAQKQAISQLHGVSKGALNTLFTTGDFTLLQAELGLDETSTPLLNKYLVDLGNNTWAINTDLFLMIMGIARQ